MFSSNTSQVSDDKLFVEDCFSCFVYTGNGSTQTITNGIDLAGKGGLVWVKSRSNATENLLYDTSRGAYKYLISSTTGGQVDNNPTGVSAFNSNGFSVAGTTVGGGVNGSGATYASWTFREAPKFFDVVTYTGNGSTQSISHNLGTAPGTIIVKSYGAGGSWIVYHQSLGAGSRLFLNATNAATTTVPETVWGNNTTTVAPTSTAFTTGSALNANGDTYVAYLFAHDTTSTGIIQCGSFAANDGTNINLGWEPQWLLTKDTASAGNWRISDNMRGMVVNTATNGTTIKQLMPNLTNAESDNSGPSVNSTGFSWNQNGGGNTYIYIAIRRGPMRTPTSGTSVFAPVSQAGGGTITTNFPVDLILTAQNTLVGDKYSFDRLRGSVSTSSKYLITNKTDAEATVGAGFGLDNNLGYKDNGIFSPSYNAIYWNFRRAPSFFDVVCYKATETNILVNHSLGAVPELIIVKQRDTGKLWAVYSSGISNTEYLVLNSDAAKATGATYWNSTTATSTTFSLGTSTVVNSANSPYVAYLFASCPGVSKVGTYTGNGSSQTINCGFAAGARFVLIKRTDSTGDWYVWDTARGIVSGNDPHLSLNTTAAEVTTDDSVDTDSSGFVVNQLSATNINVSSAQYIYMAVA